MEPVFLSVDDVLDIHEDQIQRYGGASGVREPLLLQSAVAQPRATFEGKFLHDSIFAMASAYLFHITMDHPFFDGNKRTGAAAALVFLCLNGIRLTIDEDLFAETVLDMSRGKIGKAEVTRFLQESFPDLHRPPTRRNRTCSD